MTANPPRIAQFSARNRRAIPRGDHEGGPCRTTSARTDRSFVRDVSELNRAGVVMRGRGGRGRRIHASDEPRWAPMVGSRARGTAGPRQDTKGPARVILAAYSRFVVAMPRRHSVNRTHVAVVARCLSCSVRRPRVLIFGRCVRGAKPEDAARQVARETSPRATEDGGDEVSALARAHQMTHDCSTPVQCRADRTRRCCGRL